MKTMINWYSIPCSEFDRAVSFYERIFDSTMIRHKDPAGNDMAFFFAREEGISGAINSDPALKPGSVGPRIYLNANGQLKEVLSRVPAAGGTVSIPESPIDQWGRIALIEDTEGNAIGLHSEN